MEQNALPQSSASKDDPSVLKIVAVPSTSLSSSAIPSNDKESTTDSANTTNNPAKLTSQSSSNLTNTSHISSNLQISKTSISGSNVAVTITSNHPNGTNNAQAHHNQNHHQSHHHHNSSSNGNGHHNHHNSLPHNYHSNNNNNNTNTLNRIITLEELRKYFHLPIAEVARQFGTCTTALKKICRRLNITKWPYRQILSLTKSIQSLEMASLNEGVAPDLRQQYRNQINLLQKSIAEVIKNPSKAMEALNHHQNLHNFGDLDDDNMMIDDSSPSATPTPSMNSGNNAPTTDSNKSNEEKNIGSVQSNMKGETVQNGNHGTNGTATKKKSNIIDNEEVRQIIQAATSALGTIDSTVPSSSSAATNAQKKSNSTTSKAAVKRLSEDHGHDDLLRIKRGKSADDILLNGGNGITGKMSIGGMIITESVQNGSGDMRKMTGSAFGNNAPPSSSSTSHGNLLANALDYSEGISRGSSSLSQSNSNPTQSNPYLMEVGLTTVQCQYNPELHKYHFTGQVQLAQLQRKKFRPNVVRKVVPLMEPDIGSNYSIDFFPNLTIPK